MIGRSTEYTGAYRRIGSTDRWFLKRKELVGVGIGLVDERHLLCSGAVTKGGWDEARK